MSRTTQSEPERQHGADHATVADLQFRMEKLLDELDKQAPNYANARQITEFISDRKKAVLAEAFCNVKAAVSDVSATEAEHRARTANSYKSGMKTLTRDQLNAETVIANFHILQSRLDVARSFLAIEREKIARI